MRGAGGAAFAALSLTGVDPQQLQVSPSTLDFGTLVAGATSAPQTVAVNAIGTAPVTISPVSLGGAAPQAFGITTNGCAGLTLAPGQSCTITVVAHPTATVAQQATLTIPNSSLTSPSVVPLQVIGQSSYAGTYLPVTPSRILDTRSGTGASGPVGANGTLHLQVADRGGVPASGVSAVVLNVTVTTPTGAGYITVYPTVPARPTASSLNFVPGWTGDVVGYYLAGNSIGISGGELQTVNPERLFDSRYDWDLGRLPGGTAVQVPVSYGTAGAPGFYDPHIRALAVNITAVDAAGAGYLTSWSGGGAAPNASTLNYTRGAVVPNFARVPPSALRGVWRPSID